MKRFVALFLSLTMLLSLCPINVWAEELSADDQQVYIAEDTSADELSEDDSAVESEPLTEDEQNTTDDETVEEDNAASAPSEEEKTPSEDEDEIAGSDATVFEIDAVTGSEPIANAAATVEARWGKARASGNAPYSEDWVNSGTLQQAMNYANNLTSGTAYIQLRGDVNTNTLGCLVFNEGTSTVLDLRGYKIDRGLTAATPNGNVITVNGTLTIRDTASGGQITGGYNSYYLGGGVHVAETGSLIMTGGTICGNRSNNGAGVFCYGTFTMTGGTISDNAPTQKAYSNSGGGVDVSGGTFTMSGGTISGNAAQFGGAVDVSSGIFTMNNGNIFGNLAYTYGGGIYLSGGTVSITGGKVEGNSAEDPYDGGGVYLKDGTFEVSGSPVIYGNFRGGTLNETTGMYEQGEAQNIFILNGPTIPNEDQAITVGTLSSGAKIGVMLNCHTGTFSIGGATYADTGYFISDNTAYAVYADGENLKLDTAPATVNVSFNANGGNGSMSSQAVTYASATALNPNIFTRESHVFTGWNTASDGSGTAYADGASITTTTALTLYAQWKYVEARWGLAVDGKTPDDSNWVGNGTLSEAMLYYRGISSSDTAYIQLLNNVNTNSTGALTFKYSAPAVLDLNGYTIDRGLTAEQYYGYVICVGDPNYDYVSSKLTICDTSTTVVANQGKITGGYCATEGGGIRVCINGSLTMNGGNITDNKARDGGGVYSYGVMTLNGGAISNNTVTWHGGGVYSYCQNSVGSFEMTGGTISGNTAKNGGGLYKNGYSFNMTGGTISNNTASEKGGGVYYYGSGSGVFTMSNSTISGNTANYGGGINVVTGTLDMVSGTITKNTAINNGGGVGVLPDYAYEAPSFVMQNGIISENIAVRGGGVHVENGSFTMTNGTISKNSTTNSGGGVSSWTNSSFTMDDGTIFENSAANGGGVCNIGTFVMNNGSISGNIASYGGGVYAAEGNFTMNNGVIYENTAAYEGGGVYVLRNTFTLNDGTISGNSAKDGGGVYLAYIDGTLLFDMKGGSIVSNTATNAGGGVYPTGDSTLKISGTANISRNVVSTTANNVYLPSSKVITVGELSSDASIGVTMYVPGTFTAGGAEYAADNYFISDNSLYAVAEDDENLKLAENLTGEACWGVAVGTNPPHSWVGCGTLSDAVNYANGLASGSKAYIRLLDNVETSSPLIFAADKTAILDLNGFNIDRELSAATENGNVITVNGNLTLCDTSDAADGKITGGNNAGFGGGVVVTGTFEMRGGAISGNNASYGGGISLGANNSTFIMADGIISSNTATRGGGGVHVYLGSFVLNEGEITGNTAVDGGGMYVAYDTWNDITITGGTITGNNVTGNGGGMWLDHYSLVEISGTPVISGNTKNGTLNNTTGLYELDTSGSESNAYLRTSTTLTVKALSAGANISVALESGEGVFAEPDGTDVTSLSTYATYFSSDNQAYTVVVDDTDLKLVQNEARWGVAVNGKAPTSWVGGGTFIDAVKYANTLNSGTAYIQLLSDVNTTYGISFVSGKTTILDLNAYTIDRGLTASGNANSEVMGGYVLNADGNLTLCDSSSSDVSKQGKITGGKNDSNYGVDNRTNCGGGVYVSSSGTFTLSGGNIEGNIAKQGGGVFSLGSFIMTGGAISGNSATYRGGGVCVQEGTFTMSGGTISDNTTKEGAGVDIANGSFTLSGGFISGNTASLYGGGVQGGPFVMTGGTISGNDADQGGGGVDITASNTFTMEGGTISGNTAGWGAGVNLPANGTFIMSGGTITGNNADEHAGVNAAGHFEVSGSPVITGNTTGTGNEAATSNVYLNGDKIVVGVLTGGANIGVNGSAGVFTTGGAAYADLGYFVSDSDDCVVVADGENLRLAQFLTVTFHANGGNGTMDSQTVLSGIATALKTNIFTREGYAFIGWNTAENGSGLSYADEAEVALVSPTTLYAQWKELHHHPICGSNCTHDTDATIDGVQAEHDPVTFEEINSVGTVLGTADQATYYCLAKDVTVNSTISISGTVHLCLSGKTIALADGKDGSVIDISNGAVLILCDCSESSTGKITGGNATSSSGGGVYVGPKSTFIMNGGSISGNTTSMNAGGVWNDGTFVMNGGTISENTTVNNGGGVGSAGTFTMNGGTITKNTSSSYGGGVYISGNGSFTMSSGVISENTGKNGGGVYSNGTTTLSSGSITKNKSVASGGGLYIGGGTATLVDIVISGNAATSSTTGNGGGLYIGGGTLTAKNAVITGNSATVYGGGIYYVGGTIKLSSAPVISGNVKGGTLSNTTGLYSGGTVNNVYVSTNKKFTVETLSPGTSVGVTIPNGTGVFTTGGSAYVDSGYFTADNAAYTIVASGDNLKVAQLFTISFDANGGNGTMESQIVEKSVSTALKANAFTRDGYSFNGWNTAADGTGTKYSDQGTIVATFSRTLYAQWKINDAYWGVANGTTAPDTWFDSGTLAEATEYANTLESGTAYIQLLNDVKTTAPVVFAVDTETILDLNGKTITRTTTDDWRDYDGNVITVKGSLSLCDSSTETVANQGKITGGYNYGNGGGVYVSAGANFTMNGGNITKNKVYCDWGYGGGVFVGNGATFVMNNGSISNNTATNYYVDDGTMNSGGGVSVSGGSFIMNGGTISNNTANYLGGGICVFGGSFTLNDGTISGNVVNTSGGYTGYTGGLGGGVFINGTFTLNGGRITNNTAITHGGGVYTDNCTTEVAGAPVISGNKRGTGSSAVVENVYLSNGDVLTVKALSPATNIGVTMEDSAGVFTYGGATYANSGYFVSDNSSYHVFAEGENLKLATEITGTLSISGTAEFGKTLTAVYSKDSETISYQWCRDGSEINGATQNTYTLTTADIGGLISVKITGTGAYTGTKSAMLPDEVARQKVALPKENDTVFVYNGETQTYTFDDATLYAVTNNTRTNVGSQTVTVSLAEPECYQWEDGTEDALQFTFTINKKNISVEWGNTSLTYNGSEQYPTAIAKGVVDGEDLVLAVDGAQTNASTIPYTATVTGFTGETAANYTLTGSLSTTFTISKAIATVTAPRAESSIVYGEKLNAVALSDGWTWKNGDSIPPVNNSGYTACYTPADTVNYDWTQVDGWNSVSGQVERTVPVTVVKAKVTKPAGDDTEFTYNGKVQTYTVEESALYTISNNTRTDAGSQTVTVTLKDIANYEWADGTTNAVKFSFTISKAIATVTAPEAENSIIYGEKLSAVALSDGWTWKNGDSIPPVNNSGYTACYTPADTVNYDWTQVDGWNSVSGQVERNVSVTVAKAQVEKPAADDTKFTYNGKVQTYTVEESALYTISNNTRTDAGSQTVTVTLKDIANYEWADGTTNAVVFTFVINKATQNAPVVSKTDETISKKADGIITGVNSAMEYSTDGESYTAINGHTIENLASGIYYVRIKGDENHELSPATTVEIEAGRKLTVTFIADGKVVDTVYVDYGADAAAPEIPAKEGYTQVAPYWDKDYVDITVDTEINAVYIKDRITISGTVTSFNSDTDDITIELFAEGSATAAYTATVNGNTADYSIDGVAAGTYTMKISKLNHVTREYAVVVGAEAVVLDVKICPKGDVNLDGKVNAKDWNRMYEHVNKTNLLTGYAFACGDVNADSKVNAKDWNRMYEHVNKTNPLW